MKETEKPTLNSQFFADEPTPEPTLEPTPTPESTPEPELSAEDQLQQMRVEMAKYKKAVDKATGEAATYKKQLREKLTADEAAAQEKAEREAEREEKFNLLLKENTITKFEKNYVSLGYDAELATKAATAQFENDVDALFKIQQTFQSGLIKAKEAEWMKQNPIPNAGNGEGGVKDPFLEGFGQ